jgi:hypothetical protein
MNFPGSGFFSALISSPRRRCHSDLDTGTLDEEMGDCGWYIYRYSGEPSGCNGHPRSCSRREKGKLMRRDHTYVSQVLKGKVVWDCRRSARRDGPLCATQGCEGGTGPEQNRYDMLLFFSFYFFYFQIFNSNSSKLHHKCKHNFIIIYLLFLSFMQKLLNMHPKIFILGK